MELLLTGSMLDAAEARRMGFVNEVVPAEELDEAVERWVEVLLSCSPVSLAAIKALVNQTPHLPAREANRVDVPEVRAQMASADAVEGPAAFRERRDPRWSGT